MLKSLLLAALTLSILTLAACQSTPSPTAAKPAGNQIGNTGIYVSGNVETGTTTTAR